MATDIYFSRSHQTDGLIVPSVTAPTLIGSLGPLRGGAYVLLAKVEVVTRVDQNGRDSAIAQFSLEAGSQADKAICTLWHSSEQGALQPADTVSLHLPIRLSAIRATHPGQKPRPGPTVRLYCNSLQGTLELKNIVITAIRGDSITDLSPVP